jgi:hypothetical protein
LGIGLAMGMMEFGLAMITANLAFVPAASWQALLAAVSARSFNPAGRIKSSS